MLAQHGIPARDVIDMTPEETQAWLYGAKRLNQRIAAARNAAS